MRTHTKASLRAKGIFQNHKWEASRRGDKSLKTKLSATKRAAAVVHELRDELRHQLAPDEAAGLVSAEQTLLTLVDDLAQACSLARAYRAEVAAKEQAEVAGRRAARVIAMEAFAAARWTTAAALLVEAQDLGRFIEGGAAAVLEARGDVRLAMFDFIWDRHLLESLDADDVAGVRRAAAELIDGFNRTGRLSPGRRDQFGRMWLVGSDDYEEWRQFHRNAASSEQVDG